MSRPEGLYIPEIQPTSIEWAKQNPTPFPELRIKQRYLSGWLLTRFKKYDERFALDGITAPMVEVQNEACIAYTAMKHAYGNDDLLRVDQSTIRDYFRDLCPGSEMDPVSGIPLAPVEPDKLGTIVDEFGLQQIYLVDHLMRRFSDNEALLGSGVICIAMAYNMVEAQLALPLKP